jgi:hypothetical protein
MTVTLAADQLWTVDAPLPGLAKLVATARNFNRIGSDGGQPVELPGRVDQPRW